MKNSDWLFHAPNSCKRVVYRFSDEYTLGQDVYDEINAYKAKYAFKSSAVSKIISNSKIVSINDITIEWLQDIMVSGSQPYAPGSNNGIVIAPININSRYNEIIKAYRSTWVILNRQAFLKTI